MRTSILLASVISLVAPAAGLGAPEVYRCSLPAGVTYQDHPCTHSGTPLPLELAPAVNREARVAQERNRRQAKLVREYDKERDQLHRAAERERLEQDAARARKEKRCARYTRTIDRIEDDLTAGRPRRSRPHRQERELREAREKHFTECAGEP